MLPSPEMAAPRTEADSDESPHFSLAITAFDEGARLPRSLERVMPWLAAQPFTSEVVINDDGSTDDTAAVVERFGARYPGRLRLLRSPLNQGKGAGLRRAVLATRGAVVLVSDADLSTPIEEAPRLLAGLEAGADVVIGSRIQPDGSDMRASQPRYRRLVGRLFHRLADPLVVRGIPDTQSGFKAFRGDVARELFGGTSLTSIVYDVEVLHLAQRRGYRVDRCRCDGPTPPGHGCESPRPRLARLLRPATHPLAAPPGWAERGRPPPAPARGAARTRFSGRPPRHRDPQGVPEPMTAPPTPSTSDAPGTVDPSMFREYDIRGFVEQNFSAPVLLRLGRAFGTFLSGRSGRSGRGPGAVAVGRDVRLSSAAYAGALIEGLRATGADVTDIGMVPTPLVYFAVNTLPTDAGAAVTASHNPPEYNGLKLRKRDPGLPNGLPLQPEEIQELRRLAQEGAFASGAQGQGALRETDVQPAYVDYVRPRITLPRRLKVVVDAGNGAAGPVAVRTLEAIGCEVVPLYCDPDGTFPNHMPDPLKPENLRDLIARVKETGADLGLALDGDGDRLGVVDDQGQILEADRYLILLARGRPA